MDHISPLVPLLTTAPTARNMYLGYLTTEKLVDVVNTCDEQINRMKHVKHPRERDMLLWDIRDDALLELRGRQLELFCEPRPKPS